MIAKQFLEHLGIRVTNEGQKEFTCDCPWCHKSKKLYVNKNTGLYKCHHVECGQTGNPKKMVKQLLNEPDPAKISEILGVYNITLTGDRPAQKQQEPQIPSIKLKVSDIVETSPQEVADFCKLKDISETTFKEVMNLYPPKRHVKEPIIYLPGYNPWNMKKAWGIIRAHLEGKLIPTKNNPEGVKYPQVWGSKHAIFGLHRLGFDKRVPKKYDMILLTEGWRDCIAAVEEGYDAVAFSGGAGSKRIRDNPSWLRVFEGKVVYIIMDADKGGQQALRDHARDLYVPAKRVMICQLPYKIKESKGKDLFDYVREGNDIAELIKEAQAYVPGPEDEVAGEGIVILPDLRANTIAAAFIKTNPGYHYQPHDGWTVFQNGKYRSLDAKKEVLPIVSLFAGRCVTKRGKSLELYAPSLSKDKSVLEQISYLPQVYLTQKQKAPCSLDGFLEPKTIIAANNILVSIKGKSVQTHPITAQYYNLNYLGYDYIKNAYSEIWTKFIVDITLGDLDLITLLQQWCGYLLLPTLKYQKFFLCVGEGANGKGVFFDTVAAAIGKESVSNVPLIKFNNTHTLFGTYNKLVNMSNENTKDLEAEAESVIKEYVAGDKILWERKYQDSFFDYPTAKLMFATNELPRIRDHTEGIWRRMILVPFNASFMGENQDKDLNQKLQKSEELAGILNWMIEGARMLEDVGKFVEPNSSISALNEYRDESDSARLFLLENLEVDNENECQIPCTLLHKWYQAWCENNGFKPKNNVHFGRSVNRLYPVQKSRPWFGNKKIPVYLGIKPQEGSEAAEQYEKWTQSI